MVDFNNETTVGVPAVDIERVSILQRRHDLLEAYEDYKKKRFNQCNVNISIVRVRLISLFLQIQPLLKRKMKEPDYKKMYNDVFNSTDEPVLLDIYQSINELLDTLRLTRIDTSEVYDRTRWVKVNKAKGLY